MFRSHRVPSLLLVLVLLSPVAALAAEGVQRFQQVQAWEATFELRLDLDGQGNPHAEFEGTKSVSGSCRVSEPFEDYGITWSGSGRVKMTTVGGEETTLEIEECFLDMLVDEGTYSAFFGDVPAEYGYTVGTKTTWKFGGVGVGSPELPLPPEGLVLSYDGPVEMSDDGDEKAWLKFELRPGS